MREKSLKEDIKQDHPYEVGVSILPDSFESIREMSKRQIESFEHWSRRLIDELFRSNIGDNYLDACSSDGQPMFNNDIRRRIRVRTEQDPRIYPRDIDAVLLEDLKYFFAREDLYRLCFKSVFEPFYSGINEIRLIMGRLVDIRNKLSHANAISIREAEQVLCYTNDFIDVFKRYYINQGKERNFNVPVILSFSDSQGNRSFRPNASYKWEVGNYELDSFNYKYYKDSICTYHRSGETYVIELDIDSSFPEDSFWIEWGLKYNYQTMISGIGKRISIEFNDKMVSYAPEIEIKLITNKTWHRFARYGCDDYVIIQLSMVFPPIEDTY